MKKKVALCGNGWNGENFDNFIEGFREYFTNDEVDLFIFSSHASFSQGQNVRDAENSIYMLPDYAFFDAVVIFGSGINSDAAVNQILDKCKEADVPVILQGYDIEGISSVTVDNYIGMKSLCNHIIEKHDVKDVIYIGGPQDNADSNLRLKALKDALDSHGYKFDDSKIVYANWEGNLVRKYIADTYGSGQNKLPDAFVCANDQMALFVLLTLDQIGVKLPGDVIVTGFDNLSEGRVYYPSLASVDQCYNEQGRECASFIMELVNDKSKVKKRVIPCTATPGESCGCDNCKNELEIRKKLAKDSWSKKYILSNIQGRESHLDMCIMANDEFESIQKNIKADFFATSGEETADFHIYVNPQYKNLDYMNVKEGDNTGDYYSPIMDVIAAKSDDIVWDDKVLDAKQLLIGYSGEGKAKTYVFSPLKIDASVIGYMIMGYTKEGFEYTRYVDFAGHLCKTLEKYQSNIKLFKLNEKLSELMQKDALTNVKNRVAYDNYIARMDNMLSMGIDSNIAVVMCDINNLKIINDNLGHDAGDVYIKNCCQFMCGIFKHSPIFRIGGDEFVVVISTADYPVRQEKLEELRNKMKEMESFSKSPLTSISIATGMSDFDPQKDKSIADAVKRADAAMYINKAEMKAGK